MLCARCGKEIGPDDDVYVVGDNWLNWHHYAEIGPYANVFCSTQCFADDWFVESMTLDRYLEDVVVG